MVKVKVFLAAAAIVLWSCGGAVDKSNMTNEEKIQSCMSSIDGSIFDLEYEVKKRLKDPDSFEHIETGGKMDGFSAKVRMKFRAKNSFGGYGVQHAVADLDPIDCTVSNIRIE